jgi:hypothetical protein
VTPWLLDKNSGMRIDFTFLPRQAHAPRQKAFCEAEAQLIDAEMIKLRRKGAIVKCKPVPDQFISDIFLVPKKSGDLRPVINLKQLNEFVSYEHFKMETLRQIRHLVQPGDFACTIDLADAYFMIPICDDYREFLRFYWRSQLWQFTCLCFGL